MKIKISSICLTWKKVAKEETILDVNPWESDLELFINAESTKFIYVLNLALNYII